jgi:hypothetical protein
MTVNKYIGINQRLPYGILNEFLKRYLQAGVISREEILAEVRRVTAGENRAKKASMAIHQTLSRPKKILSFLEKSIGATTYEKLTEDDRKVVILCLVASAFPITYDLLCAIATVLKVQEYVSKAFISQKISALYGSNRSTSLAIDALLPMLIELGTLERVKTGVYKVGRQPIIMNLSVVELYVATDISLSGSKSISLDETKHRSWFFFNQVIFAKNSKFKLLTITDGMVGGGYVSLD